MDILFLALLTLFIFYKLSKQLGKVSEEEKVDIYKKLEERKKQIEAIIAQAQQKSRQQSASDEKLVGFSSTQNNPEFEKLDSATKENLEKILTACKIEIQFFINGAKMAFEMTIKAFCDCDLSTLKNLLADKIYSNFEAAINLRKSEQKTLMTNLIAIDKTEILSALLADNQASIVVKFTTRQINYFTDGDGNLLNGRKDEIVEIIDIWTFKKDITSPNPNWLIASTSN